MKKLLAMVFVVSLAVGTVARPVKRPSIEALYDESDVVVVTKLLSPV